MNDFLMLPFFELPEIEVHDLAPSEVEAFFAALADGETM